MPSSAGRPGDRARCPVCGVSVTLGYGGRVPGHEAGDRAVADVAGRASRWQIDRVA